MRRSGLLQAIGLVLVAVLALTVTVAVGWRPLLGLDLQGGAAVVLEPVTEVDDETLSQTIGIIRSRVDALGVAEPEITRQGGNIVVQLPGVQNRDRALDLVGKTAELRFRPVLQVTTVDQLAAFNNAPPADGTTSTTTASTDNNTDTTTTGVTAPGASSTTEQGFGPLGASGEVALGPRQGDSATTTTAPTTTAPDPNATATTAPDPAAPAEPLGVTPPEEDLADQVVILPEARDSKKKPGEQTIYVLGPTALTGEGVSDANATLDPSQGWMVDVTFRGGQGGLDSFNALAAQCYAGAQSCPGLGGRGRIAIVLDHVVLSAAQVQTPTFTGAVQISGNFTQSEAKDLATALRFGRLPVELRPQTSQTVSATIGKDALQAGIAAGVVGLTLVALYMIGFYRMLGAITMVSLSASGMLLWSVISYLGETRGLALTLAGVTGIIVSIGVSVDSSIVYFENLREDLRGGRTLRSAVDRSFRSAYRTIVKADVASLIGAFLLYVLTVGPVRGFAFYLGLATALDLVASWFFLRPMVAYLGRRGALERRPALFGVDVAGRVAETPPGARAAGAAS
ncbi:MAG: protein translocase subunit SecD [Acidimicrobiales bacterium]